MATPTLSELIRRLERELGTSLLTRTTRRVAMTSAGAELLARSKVILDEVAAADAAVRRVAAGEAGTVRLGITPPLAPVLAPHLISQFTTEAPHVTVNLQRMWLTAMTDALISGRIDVAITCGLIPAPEGIANEVFCPNRSWSGCGQTTASPVRTRSRCRTWLTMFSAPVRRTCSRPGRSASGKPSNKRASARPPSTSPTPNWPPPAGSASETLTGSCSSHPSQPRTPPLSSGRPSQRSSSHSPCSGIPAARTPPPSPASSTPRSPPNCRPAGKPSRITCTIASSVRAKMPES